MASKGTPTVFWLLFVTALLVAGLGSLVGFAIHDEVTSNESESLVTSEAACQEIEQFFPDDPEDDSDQCRDTAADNGAEEQDSSGNSEEPPPPSDVDTLLDTADPARGQELFFTNGCNVCHGDTGQGGIGPIIAQTQIGLAAEIEQYRNPQAAMPAFPADRVPDQDVAHIYAWLQTLPLP